MMSNNQRDYIVFFKRSQYKIFSMLGDFGHVFILSKDNNNIWVGIDPCFNGLAISTICNVEVDILKSRYHYIELSNYDGYKYQLGLPMIRSCVGLVKSTLGIRNPFIWTPRQLYKYLRKY
jgi:hypothetical protein